MIILMENKIVNIWKLIKIFYLHVYIMENEL